MLKPSSQRGQVVLTLYAADTHTLEAVCKLDSMPITTTSLNSGALKYGPTENGDTPTGHSLSPTAHGALNCPKWPQAASASAPGDCPEPAPGDKYPPAASQMVAPRMDGCRKVLGQWVLGKCKVWGQAQCQDRACQDPVHQDPACQDQVGLPAVIQACTLAMAIRKGFRGGDIRAFLRTHRSVASGPSASDLAMPSLRSKRTTIHKLRSTNSLRTATSIPRIATFLKNLSGT
jgi:hypothetical protein